MNKKQIIIDYEEYLEMENSIKYYKENEQNYCKYMDNAITEVEKYKKIIDKAIEHIKQESWFCYKDNKEVIDRTPVEKLLNILKGENNER